jgi:hypoxanthine phosphoribosyltransferase
MDNQIKYVDISWNQIDRYCDKIAEDVIKSNVLPDMIVSVGRGGMVPARILSDRLGVDNVQLFSIKLYRGVGQRNNKPTIGNFSVDIQDKNILLVDDILDSGISIESVINHMQSKRPKSIKTATLLCRKSNKRKSTFFADDCEDGTWIVFPWEENETSEMKEENK